MFMDYNHNNERTLRTGNSQDRQYAYDESSHLIGEYTLSGSLIVEYIWLGYRPIAAVYSGNRIVYIVSDHQNKPRRGIDASTQQVVWSWDPDGFGAIQPQAGLTNPATINLRFPGQYYDSQSGLYYNHNRYYNPELGRYMEPDPTGLDSGLNPYAYTNNNPVNAVDPSGLMQVLHQCNGDCEDGGAGGDYGFGGFVSDSRDSEDYGFGGFDNNTGNSGLSESQNSSPVGNINIMATTNSFLSSPNNSNMLAYTLQLGLSGFVSGVLAASFSTGLGVDSHGNVGGYGGFAPGIAFAIPGFSGGLQMQVSDAHTLSDLKGWSDFGSLSGALIVSGSIDGMQGKNSDNTKYTGGGATLGLGLGDLGYTIGKSFTGGFNKTFNFFFWL
jgi:RHS repeat-associated protein